MKEQIKKFTKDGFKALKTFLIVGALVGFIAYMVSGAIFFFEIKHSLKNNVENVIVEKDKRINVLSEHIKRNGTVYNALFDELDKLKMKSVDAVTLKYKVKK